MEMIDIKQLIEVIFFKKKFISNLCGHYGEPEGVAKHLRGITRKMPILTSFLADDIACFEEQARQEYIDYIESKDNKYLKDDVGCRNCPMGNGEGGCTAPCCEYC